MFFPTTSAHNLMFSPPVLGHKTYVEEVLVIIVGWDHLRHAFRNHSYRYFQLLRVYQLVLRLLAQATYDHYSLSKIAADLEISHIGGDRDGCPFTHNPSFQPVRPDSTRYETLKRLSGRSFLRHGICVR